jgi:hypothetical protein
MGQLFVSAAGAAVGFLIGGPTGAQYGWMAGSLLGALAGQKTQRNSQALIDLKIMGTDYGQAIPYGRGTIPVAGQVWWNSDRIPIYTTTSQSQGKGGGGSVEQTTITYKVNVLFGLTDIPIAGITRIWDTSSGKLLYFVADDASVSALLASEATEEWDRLTVYTGAADQTPDPTYAAAVTNAPAYRDRGTVFIEGLNLGQSGQMRNLLFEVVIDGASLGISQREWGGMGTSVVYNQAQEVAFDPDRNELWTAYNLGSNGVGTTGKVAVYNLTTETWTFIDPPATYNIELNTNASVHARIAHGRFYCQVRIPSSTRTTAIYDLATKSLVGTVQDILSLYYATDVMIAAIDEANNTMLLEEGSFTHNIHLSADGIPGVPTHAGLDVTPTYVTTVDNNGNFWSLIGSPATRVHRISAAGVVTQFDLTGYAPITGHHSGVWVFDSARNGIYFFSSHDNFAYLYRMDCDDQSVTAVNAVAFDTSTASNTNHWVDAIIGYDADMDRIVLKRGYNYGASYSRLGYMNPDTGEMEQSYEVSSVSTDWAGGNVPTRRGFVWGLARADADSPDIAGFIELRFAVIGDDPPTVQEVVSDLCVRAGLSTGQIDVTELSSITRTVTCLPVAQISTIASVIDTLAGCYFFDMVCDNKIRFRPRGQAAELTLAYEDLGATFDKDNSEDPLALKERSDLEIPAQLALTFSNVSKDYESDTQYTDRLTTTSSTSVDAVDLQIGLTPSEGKKVAEVILMDQAASRWSTEISTLGIYCRLQPVDVINVTMEDGSILRMRSVRTRDSFPVIHHELVLDDASILESQGITSTDYTSSSTVTAPIATTMRLLDIPILRDADDDAGIYAAVKPTSGTDYPGAAIFDSDDNSTFVRQATVLESGVLGTCTTTLGDWTGPRIFDEVNSVTVDVGEGTLSSSTRDLVLGNRAVNAALIGDEIIQFVTATLVSTGVYTLTRLLRGGRGTEWAMTGHASAEYFTLLREEGIRRVPVENYQLGVGRYYKGVTLGRPLSSATAQSFTAEAIGLKPFAPVDLRASRDSSNNITVTFERRSRLTTRIVGTLGISIPLGEDSESYEVEFLNYDTDMTVQKTDYVSTPTATFSAAEQVAAGILPGSAVYCRVYQISATVGRGYVLEGVI